jgi:hypothetical protein
MWILLWKPSSHGRGLVGEAVARPTAYSIIPAAVLACLVGVVAALYLDSLLSALNLRVTLADQGVEVQTRLRARRHIPWHCIVGMRLTSGIWGGWVLEVRGPDGRERQVTFARQGDQMAEVQEAIAQIRRRCDLAPVAHTNFVWRRVIPDEASPPAFGPQSRQ